MNILSKDVARAAIEVAMSSREDEKILKKDYILKGIKLAAVDIGGEITNNINKILEKVLIASKKNKLIENCHIADGVVIGASRDALSQILVRCVGCNVGGKIGIAKGQEHLCVCIYVSVGLISLDEMVIALGHRAVPQNL